VAATAREVGVDRKTVSVWCQVNDRSLKLAEASLAAQQSIAQRVPEKIIDDVADAVVAAFKAELPLACVTSG